MVVAAAKNNGGLCRFGMRRAAAIIIFEQKAAGFTGCNNQSSCKSNNILHGTAGLDLISGAGRAAQLMFRQTDASLLTFRLAESGNEAKLLEEANAIPVHPALYNLAFTNAIDPNSGCHHDWRDLRGIVSDNFVVFSDQGLYDPMTFREVCPPGGNESLESLCTLTVCQILRIGMQDVVGIHEFVDRGKVPGIPGFLPDAPHDGLVGFFRHGIPP